MAENAGIRGKTMFMEETTATPMSPPPRARKGPAVTRARAASITSGRTTAAITRVVARQGRIKIYSVLDNGQSILAAIYTPFDVLGEVELFASRRYTLSVEALTETVCLRLPVPVIKKSAKQNYRLFMYLCGRLGAKLRDRIIAESINLRYPVANRLASYLMGSTDGKGRIIGTDDLGELADFLGSSYRQLARVVRRFRTMGILDTMRGRIRVLDRAKLRPLARDLYVRSGAG